MMNIAHTTDDRAARESGTVKKRMRMCGRPAVPSTSAIPSETVSIGLDRNVPGPSENVDSAVVFASARLNSSIGLKPGYVLEHEQRHHEDARHEQDGLDDLHPRRRQHPAEHDVAEHHHAGDEHRDREVDADQSLHEHARADHLRDEVERRDGQRAHRRRGARGALAQPEGQHVRDRVLAGVSHPLGEQEHDRQERDQEADGVQEAVEAEDEDQACDAEKRRGGQVVAGDREAVLDARDRAARGPEDLGAGHALGRLVGHDERDREDDREDHERLDVGGGDGHRAVTSGPALGGAPARSLSGPSARRTTASASGLYVRSERRRYMSPSAKTMTNCVSARQ